MMDERMTRINMERGSLTSVTSPGQYEPCSRNGGSVHTFAGWPRRVTLMPRSMRPSTILSVAAFVSAHARIGPMASTRVGACAIRASTSSSASSVRVLPVPGGPCASHSPQAGV